MKHCFLFPLLFAFQITYAQSGHFGALNKITPTLKMTPVFARSFSLDETGSEAKMNRRHILPAYGVSYSRIVGRKTEISLSYFYSRINANMGGTLRTLELIETVSTSILNTTEIERQYLILRDVPLNYHHYSLNYKYYRFGSLASVGKYIGFGIGIGMTTMPEGTPVYTGIRDEPDKETFFRTVYPVSSVDTLLAPEIKYQYFAVSGLIGRSYPVTQKISLSVGVTLPFLTFQNLDGRKYYPNLFDMIDTMLDGYYRFGNSDFRFLVGHSARAFTRMTFETGINFHF